MVLHPDCVLKCKSSTKDFWKTPPWFPGPLFIHHNKSTEDFRYFWLAVKRGDERLQNLQVLASDEDEALSGGILKKDYSHICLRWTQHS